MNCQECKFWLKELDETFNVCISLSQKFYEQTHNQEIKMKNFNNINTNKNFSCNNFKEIE